MKRRDLTGQVFGRLTAERYLRSDKTDGSIWLCRCECGKEKEVPASRLIRGITKSCGCLAKERSHRNDITGQRFGRLVAEEFCYYNDKYQDCWRFRCDCDLPHARGDEPPAHSPARHPAVYLPHARGDEPSIIRGLAAEQFICPTHVGMNRKDRTSAMPTQHLPHARGDEPARDTATQSSSRNLPHARGDEPDPGRGVKKNLKFAPRTWG